MRTTTAFRSIRVTLVLVFAVAGCRESDDELPRRAIAGKVTFDGKPLEGGMISFTPDGAGRESPVSVGAVIRQGSYAIEAAKGPTPGSYRVSIVSQAKGAAVSAAPGPEDRKAVAKESIPARYNTASTLKADVTKGGPTTFDFELSSN
jgi:hypothetical protein